MRNVMRVGRTSASGTFPDRIDISGIVREPGFFREPLHGPDMPVGAVRRIGIKDPKTSEAGILHLPVRFPGACGRLLFASDATGPVRSRESVCAGRLHEPIVSMTTNSSKEISIRLANPVMRSLGG